MVDPISAGPVGMVLGRVDHAPEKRAARALADSAKAVGMASLPKLMGMAAELAKQQPPVDSAKIAIIRSAIASGRYDIEPGRIADAILNFYQRFPA